MNEPISSEDFERALTEASDAVGLPVYYRDCVRPIVKAPRERWPRCCNSDCEPCNRTLCEVAERMIVALGRAP
jgi:hypothetical protein